VDLTARVVHEMPRLYMEEEGLTSFELVMLGGICIQPV